MYCTVNKFIANGPLVIFQTKWPPKQNLANKLKMSSYYVTQCELQNLISNWSQVWISFERASSFKLSFRKGELNWNRPFKQYYRLHKQFKSKHILSFVSNENIHIWIFCGIQVKRTFVKQLVEIVWWNWQNIK